MDILFEVEGDPFGWQRAGQNRETGAVYTKSETRRHEELIAWAYKAKYHAYQFPKGTPIELTVIAYMRIPKSATKVKREQMLARKIRPTVKADWDNLGKLVSDALNGIAYDDDKCIVDAMVRKFYSDKPRTKIIIRRAQTM